MRRDEVLDGAAPPVLGALGVEDGEDVGEGGGVEDGLFGGGGGGREV